MSIKENNRKSVLSHVLKVGLQTKMKYIVIKKIVIF